jgi:hypothetical protein
MRKPTGKALLFAALAALHPGPASAVPVADDRPLAGRVVDAEGRGIEGASVFLNRLRSPVRPALVAPVTHAADRRDAAGGPVVLTTAPDGVFSAMLAPGRYQVAAYKQGFEFALTEVGVFARGLVEIRLRQAAGRSGDRAAPPDPDPGLDWILRQDGGDVLRDLAAGLPGVGGERREGRGAAGERDGRVAAPVALAWLHRVEAPFDGRFAHLIHAGDPIGDGELSDASGRATSFALAGAIGGQGRWRVDGMSGRTSLGSSRPDAVRQGRRADQLAAAVDWRLSPRDALRASLAWASVRFDSRPQDAWDDATDQEQRTAVLRSRWDRSLGDGAGLYVDGLYLASGLTAAGPLASELELEAGDERSDSALRTTAGVRLARRDHSLDLGVRAGVYRRGLRDSGLLLDAPFEAPLPVEAAESGAVMSLYGADDWRLGDRLVLSYGLGYHINPGRGLGFLVPRVGVTHEPAFARGLRVRSLLLLRLDDPLASEPLPDDAGEDARGFAAGRVGCVVTVEGRTVEQIEVAASLSYVPFGADLPAPSGALETPAPLPVAAGGMFGDSPARLEDGAAGRREFEVELRRAFGMFHGSLSGSLGRVTGRVAPALDDGPARLSEAGEARYYRTDLTARYTPTDTEVRLGYRRVVTEPEIAGDAAGEAIDYRRIDVVVAQEMPRWSPPSARLRLLMAYQDLAYGPGADGSTTFPGAASRLTGGVEIEF